MLRDLTVLTLSIVTLAVLNLTSAASAQTPAPPILVEIQAPTAAPVSGRLRITAVPYEEMLRQSSILRSNEALFPDRWPYPIMPDATSTRPQWAAAQQVTGLAPGQTATFEADTVFPVDLSALPAGVYGLQAQLDVNDNNGFGPQGDAGDVSSPAMKVQLPLTEPLRITLSRVASLSSWDANLASNPAARESQAAAIAHTRLVEIPSVALSAFHGRPTPVRALVMTPPGYEAGDTRYPTVLYFEGFGGRLNSATFQFNLLNRYQDMVSGATPPMIWVVLDQEINGGAHAFADSASNGPWDQALVTDFIPWLDKTYRTDGKAGGRFVAGHSTGAWAALWQQVRHPDLYGGAFVTAPDYVDFRRAWETDLYAPDANVYRHPTGEPKFIARPRGAAPGVPVETYTRVEGVISLHGGQINSFDWVFSPRGPDGLPLPLFDHKTGAVDPKVAQAWKAYDISRILQDNWETGGRETAQKLHIDVGSADSYFLDTPVALLKEDLTRRGATPDFDIVPGADHMTILAIDRDGLGRIKEHAWEMYAIARPGVQRPMAAAATPSRQ